MPETEARESLKDRVKSILGIANGVEVNSVQKPELTIFDIRKLLSEWESNIGATYAAIVVGLILFWKGIALYDILITSVLTFFITKQIMLNYIRGKKQVIQKLVMTAAAQTDKVFSIIKAVTMALADGKISPDEASQILATFVKKRG